MSVLILYKNLSLFGIIFNASHSLPPAPGASEPSLEALRVPRELRRPELRAAGDLRGGREEVGRSQALDLPRRQVIRGMNVGRFSRCVPSRLYLLYSTLPYSPFPHLPGYDSFTATWNRLPLLAARARHERLSSLPLLQGLERFLDEQATEERPLSPLNDRRRFEDDLLKCMFCDRCFGCWALAVK